MSDVREENKRVGPGLILCNTIAAVHHKDPFLIKNPLLVQYIGLSVGRLWCSCRSGRNRSDRSTGRLYTSHSCPPPPSVSILSLLPPPCLPLFKLNSSNAAVLNGCRSPGVGLRHAREACVCVCVQASVSGQILDPSRW